MSTAELLAAWLKGCGVIHFGACYKDCPVAARALELECVEGQPDCCEQMANLFAEHLEAELQLKKAGG